MHAEPINPQNLDAEAALIGACLCDSEIVVAVSQIVRPCDFYAHVHGTIFEAILAVADSGKPVDKIIVAETLRNRDQLERVGGISYLSSLMDTVQTVASAEYYAKIVREKAVLNRLLAAGETIRQVALTGEEDVDEAIANAEKALHAAVDGYGSTKSGGRLGELLRRVWEQIEAAQQGETQAQDTPWSSLNALTGGFFGGEMVLWAGRPKDGKSTAIVQLLEYIARNFGPVILFALEMGEDSVVRRLLAKHADMSSRKIRRGQLTGYDFERIGHAMHTLADLPIYIFSSERSISEMRRTALAIHAKTPVQAIFVDHIGFVSDVLDSKLNENDALNKAYLRLLNVAKEINCVMHTVVHVNRQGYDQEPTMKHIRGGGNAEGHAHAIIAPYRPDPDGQPNVGKFLVLANREGDSGAIEMIPNLGRGEWLESHGGAA